MEFLCGSCSAVCATIFTNPLEVIKTRFQLQGELQKRGKYAVHYRNFFHAGFIIARTEGILALQKGLAPSLVHQILFNGARLGGYQFAEKHKLHLKPNGEVSFPRTIGIASFLGLVGAYTGSPLFLVKTRLQAKAAESIAVGHQHAEEKATAALASLWRQGGIVGLWRGVTASVPRRVAGSAVQLTSFQLAKEYYADNPYFIIEKGFWNTFAAAMSGGVAVAVLTTPLDVVLTRLYNQGVDKNGKGLLYSGYWDCVWKMWLTEGWMGFFKGIVPCYMRIGPHTLLNMVIWDQLKVVVESFEAKKAQVERS